jgi:hypothetical protein
VDAGDAGKSLLLGQVIRDCFPPTVYVAYGESIAKIQGPTVRNDQPVKVHRDFICIFHCFDGMITRWKCNLFSPKFLNVLGGVVVWVKLEVKKDLFL